MAEPSLALTLTATTYTDTTNGATPVFLYRGGYLAQAATTEYNAWVSWATTSGTADQQAIEANYSSYAFTTWIDTNGFPSIVSALGFWYPHQSGLCVRDTTYNFGGFCYIFLCGGGCDNTSGTFPASTGGDYIQPYTLTDADFTTEVTKMTDGTYTYGYEFSAALATATLESTGVDYFEIPICAEDGSTSGLYVCQQYQRATGQDADGAPRFNKNRQVEWYAITGFVDSTDGSYGTLAFQTAPNNWQNAISLSSTTLAVIAMSLVLSA